MRSKVRQLIRPTHGGSLATQDVERRVLDDLERQYAEEIARLRLLLEASSTLLGSLERETVLPEVLDLARRTLAADAYALWQLDPSTQIWGLALHSGLSADYVSVVGQAISRNTSTVSLDEPIVAEDIAATEWLTPEHRQAHAAAGTKSMLAVAMRYGDRVLGTLAFYYRELRQFTEAEKSAASLLANLAAAAIGTAEPVRDTTAGRGGPELRRAGERAARLLAQLRDDAGQRRQRSRSPGSPTGARSTWSRRTARSGG